MSRRLSRGSDRIDLFARLGALFLGLPWVLGGAGCAADYRDEAFGVLDLEPLFDEPSAFSDGNGVPDEVEAQTGFEGGDRAEYNDFGPIVDIVNGFGEPIAARVNPMYVFYNRRGQPLFAPPVRELRSANDRLNGGLDVESPNPKDFCATAGADPEGCRALNEGQRARPYGVRFREKLVDPLRGVADYQRPVVDVSPADRTGALAVYTGLWEVIEVIVPDNYKADNVKQKTTLDSALAAGDFTARSTGLVIDCPIVDERTVVPQGVSDRSEIRPLVEIWYRRKLTFCYLAHGWRTLGRGDGTRLEAGSPERLETFDVSRFVAGQGAAQESVLVVPVRKAYTPVLRTEDNLTGFVVTPFGNQIIADGRPRNSPADPPGYTPIRWMWRVLVEGVFEPDSIRSVAEVDAGDLFGQVRPTGLTKNLPLRGVLADCSFPRLPPTGSPCGDPKVFADSNNTVVTGKGDPVCEAKQLECNPRTCSCDAPTVGYGQACGGGRTRCSEEENEYAEMGLKCFPPQNGFCYLSCDLEKTNTREKQNLGREPKDFVDSRCGERPGYSCYRIDRSARRGICLKFCDEDLVDDAAQCAAPADAKTGGDNIGEGQVCVNFGIPICSWPEGYQVAN
jgi:hypothetical protein